jgi:hypothetical protein
MTLEEAGALRKLCTDILNFDRSRLLTRPEWGPFNFSPYAADLEVVRAVSAGVLEFPDDIITAPMLNEIKEPIERAYRAVNQMHNFVLTAGQDHPGQRRDQVGGELHGASADMRNVIVPHLLMFGVLAGPDSPFRTRLRTASEEFAQAKADAENKIAEALQAIEEAKTAAKTASAKVGVEVHAEAFGDEVRDLEAAGKSWLRAAVALASAAIVVAALMVWFMPANEGTPWLIQYGLTKVFVVGSLAAAAVWCGSIYRAHRHQITINRHRVNALRTFRAFVTAAETPEVRQAILMETTRAIFAGVPTGYLNATETNTDGAGRLVEAAAKATKASG